MGAQKISLREARDVADHLEKALALLDLRGQDMIGIHVQMALDMLRNFADIDEAPSGSQHHSC